MANFRSGVALALAAVSFLSCAARAQTAAQSGPTAEDKYTWLEEVSSDRAMGWVNAENAKTAKVLRADPRFASYQAEALKVISDPNRLAIPGLRGNDVENFWRDKDHMRGLLRRTTLDDYKSAAKAGTDPHWHTILDIDALNKAENAKWTYKGASRLYPGDRYTMVNLSNGGEDAVTAREFDLKTEKFVEGGFVSPHSKQDLDWLDKDTLLVARDWGSNTMTQSGYPFVVKQWKRGTPIESATELFRGTPQDVRVGAEVLHDAQGNQVALVDEGVDFFNSKTFLITPSGVKPVAIPNKSNFAGMLDGRVLLHLREDWTPEGSTQHFTQGSLLSVRLEDLRKDPVHLKPEIVFAPTATEFLEGYNTTHSRLIVTTLNNVAGRAYVYRPEGKSWKRESIPVPANTTVSIASADDETENFGLVLTGFLAPPALWMGTADKPSSLALVKSQPALFDAGNMTVDQYFATSKDGTKVPYFVVHKKDIKLDGTNPTLLNAYGGFEVSETPTYSAARGKLWLEKGGVYVLANIRGGGEFGPAWHEAGLKTKRQVIYDDFAAVGQDLIARKITSPRHLGILGGSNGGLLMGVEMEQHPDLWNAVVIQVPLLDMLGFEHIAAGASWVGEYGSVTIPEQRQFLAGISPYNNLKPDVKYPEPLIFTTTKDDRVGPQHARKFAAKMAEFHLPYYYDEITEGGHGAGADLKQEAGTNAETYIYLQRKLAD